MWRGAILLGGSVLTIAPPATLATPLIAAKVPYAATLNANLQRLNLQVTAIAPLHGGRTVEVAEVARQAGRASASPR